EALGKIGMFIPPRPEAPQLLPNVDSGNDSLIILPGPGVPGIGTAYTGGSCGEGDGAMLAREWRLPAPVNVLGVADADTSGSGVVAFDVARWRGDERDIGEGGGIWPGRVSGDGSVPGTFPAIELAVEANAGCGSNGGNAPLADDDAGAVPGAEVSVLLSEGGNAIVCSPGTSDWLRESGR
ncbi:hypothetical protein GGF48_004574, partial [Coemansia sp. RSA 921]